MKRATFLLVSHEASRTGAPKMAVEILRSLNGSGLRRIALLRWPGPLGREIEDAADRIVVEPFRRTRVVLRRWRWTRPVANLVEQASAAIVLLWLRPDIVYLNSVKSACYVRPALLLRRLVVLHSHELDPLASGTLARYWLDKLYGRVRLVACSEAARASLSRITGIAQSRIVVIPPAVDVDRITELASTEVADPGTLRGPDAPLVVGACGTADRGKGVDLWVDMASRVLATTDRNVRFIWVGTEPGRRVPGDKGGLDGAIRFVGAVPNPYPWMARFDVFTVASRTDSFGLAALEAMSLGLPVVAFNSGGASEPLGDTGRLVPAEDTEAMAEAVLDLLADPGGRRALGDRAQQRARRMFGIDRFHQTVREFVGTLR